MCQNVEQRCCCYKTKRKERECVVRWMVSHRAWVYFKVSSSKRYNHSTYLYWFIFWLHTHTFTYLYVDIRRRYRAHWTNTNKIEGTGNAQKRGACLYLRTMMALSGSTACFLMCSMYVVYIAIVQCTLKYTDETTDVSSSACYKVGNSVKSAWRRIYKNIVNTTMVFFHWIFFSVY